MTESNYKKWEAIVNKLLEWKKKEDKLDHAFQSFCMVACQDQRQPFFDPGFVASYIEGVELMDGGDVGEWLTYILETRNGGPWEVEHFGEKYDFANLEEAIQFLADNY